MWHQHIKFAVYFRTSWGNEVLVTGIINNLGNYFSPCFSVIKNSKTDAQNELLFFSPLHIQGLVLPKGIIYILNLETKGGHKK